TPAKEFEALSCAMHFGVSHNLSRPVPRHAVGDRPADDAALRTRAAPVRAAAPPHTRRVDALRRAHDGHRARGAPPPPPHRRAHDGRGLPKGISAPTLALVLEVVGDAKEELTAADVADRAGISRGTARRYLEFLASSGSLELTFRYGSTGRPEHLYRPVAST